MEPSRAICRDCLADAAPGASRCPRCGSPRMLRHPELASLSIAHIDCDAFYAAVEKRDRPELRDRPVIVGGGRRGVVATACYVARTYGVRSAMPMFKALAACPDAVVIKPDMDKYVRVGRAVRAMMQELTPLVEPISIDEAFLDLTGTERLHRATPALSLARMARRIEAEHGVTVSVGLSYCKFLAKIASDLDKPRGFAVIGREEAQAFLADKPLSILPGVGPAAIRRLEAAGLRHVGDLARADSRAALEALGGDAGRLSRLARGIDARRVTPERETKSVSSETTFDTDIARFDELEPILWRLSEKVSLRMKRAGLSGRTVTLKLKTADFRIRTRAASGPHTQLANRIFEAGRTLLRAECDGTPFRLIGIGLSDLAEAAAAAPTDLLDTSTERLTRTEAAIDALRERFGAAAVVRGIALRQKPRGA